ncbi:DUF6093 family protein [Streptomyces sioyaensis]|uniref:DUF6093 family protein n=1 Tax=Streptomyces sioyaensis TaxID=67364 RepID=UPI0037A16EAC
MNGLDAALAGAVRWIGMNLLVDTIRITLPATGDPVYDPATGQNEYPADQVLYEGPGAVQGGNDQSLISSTPDAGQMWVQETKSRYKLLTPLSAPLAPKDAVVTVIGVHNTTNTALLGRSWIAQDPARVATVEVVRVTPLDQIQLPREAS